MRKYSVSHRREALLMRYDLEDEKVIVPSEQEVLQILPYAVSIQTRISFLDDEEYPDEKDLSQYIEENLKSHWYKKTTALGTTFYFKTKNDAMFFKLRWG